MHDILQRLYQKAIREIFSKISVEGPLKEYKGYYGILTITNISPNISMDDLSRHISQNNFDSVVEQEEEHSGVVYGISRSRCCFEFFSKPENNLAQVEYNTKFLLNIQGTGQCSFQLHFIGLHVVSKEQANEIYEMEPHLFTPAARLSEKLSMSNCAVM